MNRTLRAGKRWALVLVASVAAGAAAGCATTGMQGIETDLDRIQEQLFQVQKENAALTEALAALRAAPPGGPGAATPAASGPEIRLRLEAIERDLAEVRARQDDNEQRLAALVQDLRTTRDALQALLLAPPAAAPGPVAQPPAGVAAGPLPPATGGDPEDRFGAAGTRPAALPAVVSDLGLEDLFRQGYADYTRGNYALALQELGEFVRRYAVSELADDAQYLVGEVHFSQHEYPEAITAFDAVVQGYPRGDKAGPAYLKKGLALLELNRTADAVIQLQHVITAYPRSEEARIARDRLRGLGLTER